MPYIADANGRAIYVQSDDPALYSAIQAGQWYSGSYTGSIPTGGMGIPTEPDYGVPTGGAGLPPTTTTTTTGGGGSTTTTRVTAEQVLAWFQAAGADPNYHGDGTRVADPYQRAQSIANQINDPNDPRTVDTVNADLARLADRQAGWAVTTTQVTANDIRGLFEAAGVNPAYHSTGQPVADVEARLQAIADAINAGDRTLTSVAADIAFFYGVTAPPVVPGVLPVPFPSMDAPKADIPEGSQIWQDTTTGQYYIVYDFLGSGVPMLYTADPGEIEAIFSGNEAGVVVDFRGTTQEINARGGLIFGQRDELVALKGDPGVAFLDMIEKQADVRPWMREDDFLQLMAEAMLEDRDISLAEFQQTRWWQTHNEAQRQWLLLAEADPSEATRLMDANNRVIHEQLLDAGVANAPQQLVDEITRQFTMGNWDSTYVDNQIRALSDPYSGLDVDPLLTNFGTGLDTTRANEGDVFNKVRQWLGPIYGAWDQNQIAQWAGKIRNDPDADLELTELLRNQRLAMFPTYENPQLTYDDIAAPWRNFWTQNWGEVADETDPLFTRVLNLNDAVEAGQLLRSEGLRRGNQTVGNDLLGSLSGSIGSIVRRSF